MNNEWQEYMYLFNYTKNLEKHYFTVGEVIHTHSEISKCTHTRGEENVHTLVNKKMHMHSSRRKCTHTRILVNAHTLLEKKMHTHSSKRTDTKVSLPGSRDHFRAINF